VVTDRCDNAASCWNVVSRTPMRPDRRGVCTCEGEKYSQAALGLIFADHAQITGRRYSLGTGKAALRDACCILWLWIALLLRYSLEKHRERCQLFLRRRVPILTMPLRCRPLGAKLEKIIVAVHAAIPSS
jgi:hypothetical protein